MVASQPSHLGRLPKDAIYLYSQIVKEQFTSLNRDLPRNSTRDQLCLSFVFVAQGSGNLLGFVFRVNRVRKIFYFVFDPAFTSLSTQTADHFS